jgi:hypothetical protein
VTDDDPCAFCALLASRGLVYKAETVGFEAHNDCACYGMAAFSRDIELPKVAQEAAEVYRNRGKGPALKAFRKAWESRAKQRLTHHRPSPGGGESTTQPTAPGGLPPCPSRPPSSRRPRPRRPRPAPAEPTESTEQNQNDLPQWARDAITKANKEAANYRTQVAELKPLAEQFKALEDASKSEAQRLAETAEAAKRDAETARAEAIRYKAAATHGISADHFDLLGSGSEEEITARAEKIASLVAAQAAATQTVTPPATRPVEQLRPGATPAGSESEDDVILAKLFGPPQ